MTKMKKSNNRSNKWNVKLPVRVNDDDNHSSNDELGVDIMGMSMDKCDLNSNSVRSTKNDKYDKVGNNGTYVSNDESELNVADGEKENKDDSDKMQVDHKQAYVEDRNENKNRMRNNNNVKSYANATRDNMPQEINKLRNIPIGLNELGEEVVVFDEELVKLSTWEANREKERNEMFDVIEGIVEDVWEDESIAVKNITANVLGNSGTINAFLVHLTRSDLQASSVLHPHAKDCLFVSFVIRNRPELWDKPVAVCYSDNPRGTSEISSANYPAQDHGQT
ncbi:DNA repair protein REV1 isoform X1 [Tanacetum coccineum]